MKIKNFDEVPFTTSFFREGENGGSAAPVVTPAAPAAPAADTTNNSPMDDFAGFDSAGDDDGMDSLDLGAEAAPSPDVVVAPAVTPAPVVPAPAPASAAPPVAEVPPVAAPVPKEPAAAAPPPSELDNFVQSVDANAKELTDWLAANAFALTKEEAEAFELDAVANVPKLMARVAVNNMKSTMNIVRNLVPKLIASEMEKITGSKAKASEALNEFYSANAHLNEKDHGALVTKWANAYRAANPKASRKEAIEYVGRAVSFEAGIAPGSVAAARPAPFAPARPGARTVVVPNEKGQDAFAGLGQDFDES